MGDRWLPISAFCEMYDIKPSTIRKYCEEKRLVAKKRGPKRTWHIDMWEWRALQDRLGVYESEISKHQVKQVSEMTNAELYKLGLQIEKDLLEEDLEDATEED